MSAPHQSAPRPTRADPSALRFATCEAAPDGAGFASDGQVPEWVHLLPTGEVVGRDGRFFVVDDPAAIVAAFVENGVDLPIDYHHQNDTDPGKRSGPAPAAGWIKDLVATPRAIWGRVEWTARAKTMIAAREFRYLSPSILYSPEDRRVVRIKGAGLVHNPNLHLTALAAEEEPPMPPVPPADSPAARPDPAALMARLAQLLKMPPDADPEAVIAALERALTNPDPQRFVPAEAVQEMLRDRNQKVAALSEGAARTRVEDALARGYITPGLSNWALSLCREDPDRFDDFVAKAVPAFAHLSKRIVPAGAPPGATTRGAGPDVAEALCAQLGLPPGTLKA